jgi:hypothetical protein
MAMVRTMIVHVSLGEIVGFVIAVVVLAVYWIAVWRVKRQDARRRRGVNADTR